MADYLRHDYHRKLRSVDMPQSALALPSQNAIIRISLFGPPTGGTWGLEWVLPEGTLTIADTVLDFDCTAADIKAALEADALVDVDDFIVSGDEPTGGILIEAHADGQFAAMPLNKPTLKLTKLEGICNGGHPSYDRIGRA